MKYINHYSITNPLGYYIALVFLFLSTGISLNAQIPISWSQNFGDAQKNIIQDVIDIDNQGCITIGYTQNGITHDFDLWISRINNSGSPLWTKNFGGTGFERATAAALLDDGNIVIAGFGALTDGDSDGASKRTDGVIIKMDPSGNILWHKTYGGLGQDHFFDVIALPAGECLVVGSTSSYINNFDDRATDGWALRVNTSGGAVWNRRFGGTLMDRYNKAIRNEDGSFLLGGTSNSRDGESPSSFGGDDLWISNVSIDGVHNWSRNYGGAEGDELQALVSTIDGGYLIGATSYSALPGQKGYGDIWVLKVSVLGNQVWEKVIGGTATDKCTDIQSFEGDGFLLSSTTMSDDGDMSTSLGGQDAWLSKLSATGSIEWSEQLGGSHNDALNTLAVTTDGSVWMAGYSFSQDVDLSSNLGAQDGWLIRSNAEAAPIVSLGGNVTLCIGSAITLDATDPDCTTCQYLWNDNITTPSRTIEITGSVSYSVTLTNSAGETTSDDIEITAINPITAAADLIPVTCADSATGAIALSTAGGTTNYTYNWSNSETTATNSNLIAGTYFVTISDEALCEFTDSYTLDNPVPITIEADIELPSCTTTNLGAITVLVSGGESPYTYDWSNGFIGPTISGLEPGQYTVTVTDFKNCEQVVNYLLSNEVAIDATADIQHVTCPGNSDGEISLNVSGDFPPFSFKWENNFTSTSLIGLSGGQYTLTITDAMDCKLIQSYEIIEPEPIQILENQTNTAMNEATGRLLLNISGGTAPYDVDWSNGEMGVLIEDLDIGFYTATITDARDCTYEQTFEITVATSTLSLIAQALEVHPNPSTGQFYIQVPSGLQAGYELTLYNIHGQSIAFEKSVQQGGQLSIEVIDFVSGLYLLSIIDRSTLYQSKVILH